MHFTEPDDAAIHETDANTENMLDEGGGEQTCCVCDKPAEGEDVCECSCPNCGVDCFDDVTLVDHGMCYDCHKKRLLGTAGEEEEEKLIVPTVDFEWYANFFGGNYSGIDSDTAQVPVSLIDQIGEEAAFEQFTHLARCHIISWTPKESEAYGNGQTQKGIDQEQKELQSFAQRHAQKCMFCEQLPGISLVNDLHTSDSGRDPGERTIRE